MAIAVIYREIRATDPSDGADFTRVRLDAIDLLKWRAL
jgi:hypothetical protein